jgi:hypothetical protein
MDILSYQVNMLGGGSLDNVVPDKYSFLSLYNAGSEYSVVVLMNGNKIYDLPAAFIGSLPIGALQQGGVGTRITIQWTDIAGSGLPGFLQLIYSEEQIVTSAVSSNAVLSAYMPMVLMVNKGDLLVGLAAATPTHIPVGIDGQVLIASSPDAAGVKWSAVIGAGLGNVTGPPSAVNGHVALWDGMSGELLKDGGLIVPSAWLELDALSDLQPSARVTLWVDVDPDIDGLVFEPLLEADVNGDLQPAL